MVLSGIFRPIETEKPGINTSECDFKNKAQAAKKRKKADETN